MVEVYKKIKQNHQLGLEYAYLNKAFYTFARKLRGRLTITVHCIGMSLWILSAKGFS